MTATFALYVLINGAMVMGLAPVVGVPMPLLSYGGTVMMTMMVGFGLVHVGAGAPLCGGHQRAGGAALGAAFCCRWRGEEKRAPPLWGRVGMVTSENGPVSFSTPRACGIAIREGLLLMTKELLAGQLRG